MSIQKSIKHCKKNKMKCSGRHLSLSDRESTPCLMSHAIAAAAFIFHTTFTFLYLYTCPCVPTFFNINIVIIIKTENMTKKYFFKLFDDYFKRNLLKTKLHFKMIWKVAHHPEVLLVCSDQTIHNKK